MEGASLSGLQKASHIISKVGAPAGARNTSLRIPPAAIVAKSSYHSGSSDGDDGKLPVGKPRKRTRARGDTWHFPTIEVIGVIGITVNTIFLLKQGFE